MVVIVGPSLVGLYYSLTEWSGYGEATFVGLTNFRTLIFDDMDFRKAFGHNLMWLAFFMTVPVLMALIVASLLATCGAARWYFVPPTSCRMCCPAWLPRLSGACYTARRSAYGAQLEKLGIQGAAHAFLGDPATALPAIAFADNWHWWGFLMILFLTAMQNIPRDLYDAAKIDGADRWQEFRYVTVPGIRPTVFFMLMMTAIWAFVSFDYVWILTQGGPAGSSEMLATYLYKQAFQRFEAGYATAIGLTISLLAGIIVVIFAFLRRLGWEI